MGNPLLQKKGNPGATAVNNAGNPGHGTMPGTDPELEQLSKEAREVMHDDFGAQTGLRRRPDYGESDSPTSTLNRENSKGASYHVAVYNSFGTKEATGLPRYVASVEWAGSRVENVTLSSDQSKAAHFPAFTARSLSAQLTHPGFALSTAIIKA